MGIVSGVQDYVFKKVAGVLTSRFIKSFARYILAGLITLLASVNLPGFKELSEIFNQMSPQLVDILVIILGGLLGTWSVTKNLYNANSSEDTK